MVRPPCIPRNTDYADTNHGTRTSISQPRADRFSNVHCANRSPGFAILVLLPSHAVSEGLPGCQPVIHSKGGSAVIGKKGCVRSWTSRCSSKFIISRLLKQHRQFTEDARSSSLSSPKDFEFRTRGHRQFLDLSPIPAINLWHETMCLPSHDLRMSS